MPEMKLSTSGESRAIIRMCIENLGDSSLWTYRNRKG